MTEKGKEIKAKALERIHKNEAVMMEGFSEAEISGADPGKY